MRGDWFDSAMEYRDVDRTAQKKAEEQLAAEPEPICDNCEKRGSDCDCPEPSFEGGRRG